MQLTLEFVYTGSVCNRGKHTVYHHWQWINLLQLPSGKGSGSSAISNSTLNCNKRPSAPSWLTLKRLFPRRTSSRSLCKNSLASWIAMNSMWDRKIPYVKLSLSRSPMNLKRQERQEDCDLVKGVATVWFLRLVYIYMISLMLWRGHFSWQDMPTKQWSNACVIMTHLCNPTQLCWQD